MRFFTHDGASQHSEYTLQRISVGHLRTVRVITFTISALLLTAVPLISVIVLPSRTPAACDQRSSTARQGRIAGFESQPSRRARRGAGWMRQCAAVPHLRGGVAAVEFGDQP